MAQPSALQSRVRQWINAIEVVEATDVDIQVPKPVGFKFGAAGPIGSFKGQAAARVSITFAQVADKSQFETHVSTLENFTYAYTKGSSRFILTNCELGDTGLRNTYESGDSSVSLAIVGIGPKQVA